MREALAMVPLVEVAEVGQDHYLPPYRKLPLRIANRLLHGFQIDELESAVRRALTGFHPDVIVVYKGAGIHAGLLNEIQIAGIPVVNIFPDLSPHAHGRQLQEVMGRYDLVVSTKPFHPQNWRSVYGYRNLCVCVPHGYDPNVHYWADPSLSQAYDVALCCTWRPEYHSLMRSFATALGDNRVSVVIAGAGWTAHREHLPAHWQYVGPRLGRAYGEFLRSARIAIALVNREMVIGGVKQLSDEDSTRTYELAAAHCFFLHQRTDYVATVYDERSEVPFWSDAAELADLVRRWLPDEAGRGLMAARAHARAVPAYSIPQRATSVLRHIEQLLGSRRGSQSAV